MKESIDQSEIINKIEQVSEPPYTACIYYSDYNEKNISVYKKKGWNVISLGNRSNNKRLFQLHDELNKNKNFISTEIGTSTFYALFLKKMSMLFMLKKNNLINPAYENEFLFGKKIYSLKTIQNCSNHFLEVKKGLN